MAHQSENASRLRIDTVALSDWDQLPAPERQNSDVWLIVLPFGRRLRDAKDNSAWLQKLRTFAEGLGPDAVLALLTSAEDAAVTWPELEKALKLQLWVAVKLQNALKTTPARLPEHHAALLVMSRYCASLRHTKTRIAYAFCPVCDMTTKDYGGKKHTYHEYGTLMSDVWRDIAWTPTREPTEVAERLADVFGLEPHRRLHMMLLTEETRLKPRGAKKEEEPQAASSNGSGRPLPSELIQQDCLKGLRAIPDNAVDFCFADPPYNLAKHYDRWDDAIDIEQYFAWCDTWLDELARVLRPARTLAVLNIPQWAIRHFSHLKASLQFQNWIVWEGLSLPVRRIMPAHYSILCFSKGAPRPLPALSDEPRSPLDEEALSVLKEFYCLRSSCMQYRRGLGIDDRGPVTDLWWDIHRLKHNSRRVDHPCQLPPALMRRLIATFTRPGEMVLDPFNGAGTTTLCAEAMGRRFIGIELSEPYHTLALARHDILRQGGDPFAKIGRVPKAKNSRVKRIGNIDYQVPKKTLQLEIREIAHRLGHLPTREDVQRLSKYPIRYFDEYFISWGEVCAAARTTGMKETRGVDRRQPRTEQNTLFDLAPTHKP
jgi:site-specific DNA-methyltransferase (adenine-specific)